MDYHSIYQTETPEFLLRLCDTPPLRRLRDVGMNCGCEYTAFPRFAGIERYTRFEHSLGAALIVWRFTHDEKQAAAALLHDVATPVFAHVVDFLCGDYLEQTATESGTAEIIRSDAELGAILRALGLRTGDVEDYHRYPIADNDPPRLSADRLDYTCGNAVNFSLASREELSELFADLRAGENESGETELVFQSEEKAARFAFLALDCSRIYVCDADRYAMQRLSELLRAALAAGVICERDLASTEEAVIAGLCADPALAADWAAFRALRRTERADAPDERSSWRKIFAKHRRIDPFVAGRGRVSALDLAFAAELNGFMNEKHDYFVLGE
ncbi:MAG: HD domain-containing protein [Oscillospiraceae bacterium]|nr:HD domain-containing protein [Oscillospiraceae bacterium]